MVAEVPPIGVASLPAPTDQERPPAPVPSVAVPEAAVVLPPGSAEAADGPLEPLVEARQPPRGAPAAGEPEPGFSPGVWSKLGSYVYLLVDPRTGRPFYVGRGRKDRCFRLVQSARESAGRPVPPGEDPVLERIRQVESGDRAVRIDILRHGLSPEEALLVEAATHEALGLHGAPTLERQRRSASEVNALLTKRAKIKRAHQLVLLRIGACRRRCLLRAGPSRVAGGAPMDRPGLPPRSPVGGHRGRRGGGRGLPDRGWEPAPAGPGRDGPVADPGAADRPTGSPSSGSPDPELEKRYVGKSVEPYLGGRPANPVTYVWCGPHWVNAPA